MKQEVFNTLTELEMRDEKERLQNVPIEQRVLALNPDAAKFLYIVAMGAKAKNIVEIGTNRGYSTIWLALIAQKFGGKVVTCELEANRANEARTYFDKAGLSDYIEILVGDARETLRSYEGPLDLVFIDGNKADYEAYFDVVYKKLGVGGLVIADNVISHEGELEDYVSYMQNHMNLDSCTVPVGSGLELTVKIAE